MSNSMNQRPTYRDLFEESLPDRSSPLYQINLEYGLDAVERGGQAADHIAEHSQIDGEKVLDLGCGEGGMSVAFALRGGQVTSLDIDEDRIYRTQIRASEHNVSVQPVIGDALATQLDGEQFQVIVCNDILEHVVEGQKLAHEIDRLLKPGGVVYLETQNRLSIFEFLSDPANREQSHLHLLLLELVGQWSQLVSGARKP